jgi:hypothetical protein
MKKLILLIVILLCIHLAEAKTILYVTNSSTDTPCSSLQKTDLLYCNRLLNLGYNVKVLDELHVKEDSDTWSKYANDSDMIFLGSDSQNMVDKTKFQNAFCGNLSIENKPLFFTSVNTWISKPNIEGCAFHPSINLVSFNFSDNKCSTKTFKIAKTGFITEGFNNEENITIYPSANNVKIYNISTEGWITAECVPIGGSIEFYPLIFTNNKGVFWGLDDPSSFSNATWDIFDRTVLYMFNDTGWQIKAFTIPSIATVNQDILIFANVTQNNQLVKGIVNYTIESYPGSMFYYNGLWKSDIKLAQEKQYNIILAAYSKSLRGTFNLPVNVGSLSVSITSGNFKPNLSYLISAQVQGATSGYYKIINSTTYDTISSGSLNCGDNNCSGIVDKMLDTNSLLLEVTSSGNGKVGGSFKNITKEALSTDKNAYKPGDMIKIDFFTTEPVTQTSLTIIRPDGTKEIPSPIPLDQISSNYWSKNYNLGINSLNGTWVVDVKTAKGEYNKSIDIIAWNSFAYLNKKNFDVFENLILTVGITEAYSSNLNVNITAETTNPDGNLISLGNSIISGNNNHDFSYIIPRGYPDGLSNVKITFKDSSNRSVALYLNFSTNLTLLQPSLFITPNVISETTIAGKTIVKTITLENTAKINATNVVVNVFGLDIHVQNPSFIEARKTANATITINTYALPEGLNNGNIYFYSQVGDAVVSVSLDVIGDIASQASQKYSQLTSIENNLTYLEKMWVNTTDAMGLLSEVKNDLNESAREYRSENYAGAKAKFEEASDKFSQLETKVNNLHTKLPDYSFVIWDFAAAVILIIVITTIIKIKGRKKKSKVKKKEVPKEESPKKEVYFEPKGGEYRTEYY